MAIKFNTGLFSISVSYTLQTEGISLVKALKINHPRTKKLDTLYVCLTQP